MPIRQPESADIALVREDSGEVTLFLDGGQAMQAWEQELMHESADIMCSYGSVFLEVGLGLGISALYIAKHPNTRKHVVVEKYKRVIDLFEQQHPTLPPTLTIIQADFFEMVSQIEPASLDGIFFDPYLPKEMNADEDLWKEVVPLMTSALRVGGVLVPFLTSRPVLRWQFVPYFDRVIVERRSYTAYDTTEYMSSRSGNAYIQCFVKTR
ncbi:MAG: hypothetical protein QOH93_2760 [Chloroflexia bacterium]|nr:hypothetical protein [Chloroflexia bacterium]